jgi:hypothetical protein
LDVTAHLSVWSDGARNRLTRCRQARVPRYTLNSGAVLLGATARWTIPPVTPNALETTATRAARNRLTRCRQARVPGYTLNAGAVLFGATAHRSVWSDGARNRLTRCRQARVPRYTLNAGVVLLDVTARWTIPPVTPNALERRGPREIV